MALEYDVIVVGGGHAGCEAALAAARLGARCALVTHDIREIGRMPCNPAIGGLGKGHLVREIDVLGGEMGLAIDVTGIQFRILNRKKGPAVQSPRAQADKYQYQKYMMAAVLEQDGLDTIAGDVVALRTEARDGGLIIAGVGLASGREISAGRVVLCTGTFLRGLMHTGPRQTAGGREGASASEALSDSLGSAGLKLQRLKTGTPPRLARDSIDFSKLTPQPGDQPPQPFSFRTDDFAPEQDLCHLAYTNEHTHSIIQSSLERSPLFGGIINGRGPRYCPSIEDKVVRFADKDRHLLFLEPEGRDSLEIYVNGLSTSLPADVQDEVVRSVAGLERARIVRYGYAVEYDSLPSWQVGAHLECKAVDGLFLAGQILGTSGYEEAAGQGLLAGVNAVRSLDGAAAVAPGRQEAYLGVLVDDLVTKQIDEPYRMFTSRAEHRLHLRCDNTEQRLGGLARELGLLPDRWCRALAARQEFVQTVTAILKREKVLVREQGNRMTAANALRLPGLGLGNLREKTEGPAALWKKIDLEYKKLLNLTDNCRLLSDARVQIENDCKYDGYIAKHNRLMKSREHLDHLPLPDDLEYQGLTALSFEAREKLERYRPANLGQAGRIDGVRAGDLAVLTVYLKRLNTLKPGNREGEP